MPKTPMSPQVPTVSFVSLGCSKNLVDSERMLGLLAQDGYAIVPDAQPSDLVVVNTCGFIDAARQESIGVIEETAGAEASRARQGGDRRRLPGRAAEGGAAGAVPRGRPRRRRVRPRGDRPGGRTGCWAASTSSARSSARRRSRRRTTAPGCGSRPRHLTYLKVSEGCDRICTFCAIPYMRGKHVTKPMEMVVAEAEELAGDGVRELVLVAQDMTYYGVDLYGRPRLAELLRELDRVEGIDWIRILYCYPQFFTDELYDVLGAGEEDRPVPRHAAAAHQRPDAEADEPPAHAGRDRDDHRAAPRDDPGPGDADDVHRRLPRRDRRRVRRAGRVRRGDAVRAARRLHVLARARHARPPSCRATCPPT